MAKDEHTKARDEAAKGGGQAAPLIEQALAEQANNDAYGVTEGGAAKRLASVGHATGAEHHEAAAQRKKAAEDDDGKGKDARGKDARHAPPAGRAAPHERQDRA